MKPNITAVAEVNIDKQRQLTMERINRNKLHAVLCILASASFSFGVLAWLFW